MGPAKEEESEGPAKRGCSLIGIRNSVPRLLRLCAWYAMGFIGLLLATSRRNRIGPGQLGQAPTRDGPAQAEWTRVGPG
jgi:hypothetical protein